MEWRAIDGDGHVTEWHVDWPARMPEELRDRGPSVVRDERGDYRILIDGLPLPEVGYPHDALVDGDARCQSIAAAAILAKTVRDALMQRLAARHPGYGWETNMGYGTEEHHAGLRAQGPTAHHRKSFEPIAQLALF